MLTVDQPVDTVYATDDGKAETVDVKMTGNLVSLRLAKRPLRLAGLWDPQRVEPDLLNLRAAWTRIHLQPPDEAGE